MKMKKVLTFCLIIAVVLGLARYYAADKSSKEPGIIDTRSHTIDRPGSLWIIVNKQRPLNPRSYSPDDLVASSIKTRETATVEERQIASSLNKPLKTMVADAHSQGVSLNLQSGYRSYNSQKTVYENYVKLQGKSVASEYSAEPGYSEHQTGLAIDIGSDTQPNCNVRSCFADTPEAEWLDTNAHKYGFIIRYPENKDSVTGYKYEPWHLRYVGSPLAQEVYDLKLTLEEFFFKR